MNARLALTVAAGVLTGCARGADGAQRPRGGDVDRAEGSWGAVCTSTAQCGGGLDCRPVCLGGSDEEEGCALASTKVCERAGPPRALSPAEWMVVLGADRPYAILGRADDFGVPIEGAFDVLGGGAGFFVAGQAQGAERLTDTIRALADRTYAVMSDRDRVCVARAGGVYLVALEPEVGDRDTPSVGTRVEVDRLEYASIHGTVYVGLALPPECAGGLWARDEALPSLAFAPAMAAPRAEAQRALGLFAKSPLNAIEAENFAAWEAGEDGEAWLDYQQGAEFGPVWGPEVHAITLGDRRSIVISAHVGHACAGYAGALLLTFHVVDGVWRAGAFSRESAVRPRVGLDMDGDGELEILSHEGGRARLWSRTLSSPSWISPAPASSGC